MAGPYDGAEVLVWVNMSEAIQASVNSSGTTNSIFNVTANTAGTIGNSIRLTVATPAGAGPIVVTVTYSTTFIDIVVTPPTTATAAQVRDAINAAAAAKYYVTAGLPATSNGTGIVVATAVTPLAGGAAAGAANFVPVTRQQGVDWDDTMDTIDAVSKGDRFALQLAGRQSGSFELSGLHSYEDDTQERIRRAYQKRELVLFRRITPPTVYQTSAGVVATLVQEASCRVTGFSISHPDSDVATFTAPVALQENWRNI